MFPPKPSLAKNGEIGRGSNSPDNVRAVNEYGNRVDNVMSVSRGDKRVDNVNSIQGWNRCNNMTAIQGGRR